MFRNATIGMRAALQPVRAFCGAPAAFFAASSSVFAPRKTAPKKQLSAAQKAVDQDKKKLRELRAKLKKEKEVLRTVRTKILLTEKKHREIIKVAEKVAFRKATQPVRKIGAYSFFVKSVCSKDVSLTDAAVRWTQLSQDEKAKYEQDAKAYNDEKLKDYKPKPKAPASSYAQFIKANYPIGESDVTQAQRTLSAQWLNLSDEEKAAYAPSEADKEAYKTELAEWTRERMRLYRIDHPKTGV